MNKDIKNILEELKQNELIEHYNSLTDDEKKIFLDDLSKADFQKLALAFNQEKSNEVAFDIKPQNFSIKEEIYDDDIYKKGLDIIKNGQAAILIMSGGMGSRLGFDAPKGAFILANNKSIFEIHIDNLRKIYQESGYYSYLLIMCSDLNYQQTIDFFENNKYFNYPKEKIKFFKQANIPACDEYYKILLSSKTSIKQVPDGNGGVFDGLKKSLLLDFLKKEGVKWLQVVGVDNVLLKVLDPFFIGFAENSSCDIASKSVERKDPKEKVGIFAIKDNKPSILEYGEIDNTLLNKKKDNGEYYLSEANIAYHLFNIQSGNFDKCSDLQFHRAHKKIEYYFDDEVIIPDTENAYKFEQFIFDSFKYFDKMAVLRVKREEEFSPLKNKVGKDSVESARKDYLASLE